MKIYLVGGAVRDQLLNYPYSEKDWVVVGSTPDAMTAKGFTPVGKDFPVFLHPKTHEEYALARTERKTAPGYKGFTFHTSKDVTLEEDLQRRDLTINAIAQSDTGEIIDPYHGQQDIDQKWLRHVSLAFREDPVRVLRVARFAARYHHLGFRVADTTYQLMQTMVDDGETQHLVAERVWQECQKALSEKSPEQFIHVLLTSHAIKDIFPDIPTEDIQSCSNLLEATKSSSNDSQVRFAILCFLLKAENISSLCKRLAVPNIYSEMALLAHQHYHVISHVDTWSSDTLSTLFIKTDVLRKPERFELLLRICSYISQSKIDIENNPTPSETTSLLLDAMSAYKKVNHQQLIEQGYTKSDLGKAISTERKKLLSLWLKNAIGDK